MTRSTGIAQLATLLQGRGLATTDKEAIGLTAANPISSTLNEVVRSDSGSYATSWGYAIGQVGQEASTADRLAFLLGVPDDRR